MLQFVRWQILTLIIAIGAAHGVLVVGPKFIRPNQDYSVVISNVNTNRGKVDLMLRIEGVAEDGMNVLNISKNFNVRQSMNRLVTFKMPENLSDANYKITIDGLRGFSFHQEAELVYLGNSESGLIQINKPVFKPGDTVQFRVIVLDTELKPSARIETVQVMIRDPQNNVVRNWSSAELHVGVFENNLQIAPTPMLGMWKISVLVDGEVLVSKTFEVKEYVLSLFDVEVAPTVIPLVEHQGLNLTIAANYHFRKPVKGHVKVELYLEDDKRDQVKEFEMSGIGQVNLRFNEELELFHIQQDVTVKTTFIEQDTNRTVVKESQITVYKYPYRMELLKNIPYFQPGLPFKCALQFRYHDGTPAKGVTGKVEVMEIGYETTATSDDEGLIKLELNPIDSIDGMDISFSNDVHDVFFNEQVSKTRVDTNAFIKLELKSPIHLHSVLQFLVTCSDRAEFFVYYIVSKGNIIDSGFLRMQNPNKYVLQLNATEMMLPKAKVIVATVVNRTLVYDFLDMDFIGLRNSFELSIDKQHVKPGEQIELRMSGRPGAYVGLAAYDKSLLYCNANHDIFWEDVMQLFEGIHAIEENEFDMFHSTGLFLRTLDDIKFNEVHDMSARHGLQTSNPNSKLALYRTNFAESWLWKNVTIGGSGTNKMIEAVPDTITSWYLTGFSIDPEYGLGIIKNPIEFTTIQPFYIVESLPYSIKRGEVVELQFTLFNNLGEEYNAEVTLYNVFNQMEFVGRSLEDESYTKSVSVPPKIGVPISFLVKARSLGEITVRIEATIKSIHEREGLEKVIRVTPESLVQLKMESRFFHFDTYSNETFRIYLNIVKKADMDSKKVEFRLNPNLFEIFTIKILDDLLTVPVGNGVENMIKLAPNIIVLDYLHAIGSKEQNLIDKTISLLRQGYQNQMRYRQTDGSFGVWQNDGGSVFLTAFVAKSMQTASKYISEVDVAMVEKAYDWLASKQHSSGRFDEVGAEIHQGMQGGLRDGISLTSFVVTALLENEKAKEKHAAVIQKTMSYLSSNLEDIQNPYDLSIATYALMLYGHEKKTTALEKLIDLSTRSNYGIDIYRVQNWNTNNSIETTAYALLSFVTAQHFYEGISVMRWLMNQRYVTGSFAHTQDTFVGLTALTKLAEKFSTSRNNYTIHLKFSNETQKLHVNSDDNKIVNFEDIPADTKLIETNVEGVGAGLLQVIYHYSLNLVNFENRFKLDLEKQDTTSDDKLMLKVCVSFIPSATTAVSEMAMIEVTFPSGFVVDQNPISEQTSFNPIQHTEIRYGGTTVVVYYNNMDIERNCFTVTAYRRLKVALKRPAYVVVYDYYNPKLNAIKSYEVDSKDACDVCEQADCPKDCSKE
uniref:TEP1-F n=1 Tax=Anopheles funestus TaxID=62324 RepID=A0A4Y0BER6_ANOFN